VTAHLSLLCHAATASTRAAAFPQDDEPLDPAAEAALAALRGSVPYADRRFVSPLRRARQTAETLGLEAAPDPDLTDLDYGLWRGLSLEEAQQRDPEAVQAWLAGSAPPGGESLDALIGRARRWLEVQAASPGVTLAVTHAAVVRAVLVAALDVEPRAFWRFDIAPLALARLSGRAGRWNLVGLAPLAAA